MLAALIPIIGSVIDKIIPDKEAADRAKLQMMELEQRGEFKDIEIKGDIIKAEASSDHPLTSQWRPITMLVFVAIIANNYILAPYILMFFSVDVSLQLPPDLWDLLKIGLGGYVMGRSAEKGMKLWKQ